MQGQKAEDSSSLAHHSYSTQMYNIFNNAIEGIFKMSVDGDQNLVENCNSSPRGELFVNSSDSRRW